MLHSNFKPKMIIVLAMPIADLVILFSVSLLAATLSGAAGFGGALLLFPIVTNIVGIEAAIPIITIGQLFGNASRVAFNWQDLKWKPVALFLITAIPLTIAGSYLFTRIDGANIKTGVGIFLILMVVYRRLKIKTSPLSNSGMLIGGGLTGFISGIAGSAGPIGAAFFLGLGLTPSAYIASEAFTALAMHLTKSFMYNRLAFLGQRELLVGLLIGSAMILGSWFGKNIILKLSPKKFIVLVEILLIISGIQLIVSAFLN